MPFSRRALLISLLPTALCRGRATAADSPTAVIQRLCDTLIAVMRAAKQLSIDERYRRLAPVISQVYNLPLMSQVAVGAEWAHLAPAQQQRLSDEFAQYTIAVYANRFDSYNGQRFEIDPNPLSSPNGTIVQTRLIRADGSKLVLNYLMRQGANGQWQAIDVYMSGTISELATRRSDFVSVLQKSGVDGLLQLLATRTADLRAGSR
jgi:phospholipid transport system substrate-binding protein